MASPYLYVGYNCNNNCIFCSELGSTNPPIKPLEQLQEELTQIRKEFDFVNIMGLEPTIRPDILKIINLAKKLKFKQVGMTTNGRLLSYEKFCEKLLQTNIDQIVISLHGPNSEIHDTQTRVKESFDQTVEGIKNLLRFKKEQISILVNLSVDQHNYKHMAETAEFVYNLGIKEINFLNIMPLGERQKTKSTIAKLSDIIPYLIDTMEKYKNSDLKISFVEFPPCIVPKEYQNRFLPCLGKNPHKIKFDLCKTCEYDNICTGILREYFEIHGNEEFETVTNSNSNPIFQITSLAENLLKKEENNGSN